MDDDDDDPVPLPNVNGAIMRKVKSTEEDLNNFPCGVLWQYLLVTCTTVCHGSFL